MGRVFNTKGYAVTGAWVELWQADAFGAYHHPNDPSNSKADPNFQGFAVVRTAKDGAYKFRTIKPKSYLAGSTLRTPHIHFHIIEDTSSRLVTQMYFPNEQLNQKDILFDSLSSAAEKNAATARLITGGPPIQYHYDIVI